jgi:very-short-patch-repair endonuclease
MKHKSRYIIDNISSLKGKVYEMSIIAPLLCDKDLLCVRPYTQFPVETTDKKKNYIDLYYEDIRLGIEIYEPFHGYQAEEDENRKNEIEKKLECKLIEVRIDDNFIITDEIQNLKELILEQVEKERQCCGYKDWDFAYHTREQAKRDYPNAIFVNADNFQNGVHGPIKINEEIRNRADLFVVYSGSTVCTVFDIRGECWKESDDLNAGYLQYGIEIPNHELVASGATDWNVTTNRFLGENIEKYSTYKRKDNIARKTIVKNNSSQKRKFKNTIRKTTKNK